MLNKKDFLKYASKLAFPIMIQNLIGTLVNIADTVMLGYVSQTAMSASSLANQYTFILFCLYYGMATGTSVLCAQYWGKGDKKTVEKILGLAERISLIISLIFFVIQEKLVLRNLCFAEIYLLKIDTYSFCLGFSIELHNKILSLKVKDT